EQLAQVALDAEVGQHPRQGHLVDAALAELQDEVVGLRAPHLVGTDHHRLAVLNEGLVAVEPVGPEPGKPSNSRGSGRKNSLPSSIIFSTAPPKRQPWS